MEEEKRIQTEDEINLMDYVLVILKRKGLILGIFLIAIIATGIFSFLSPKIYRIDTALEIGQIDKTMVESPDQVKEKIDGDVYGILVRHSLGISEKEYLKIKTENPKGTILIKMKIESDNTALAKSILDETNKIILEKHGGRISAEKETLEKNIKTIENKIKILDSDIEKTENKILPLKNNIKRIENKIGYAEEEKENLDAKVAALQKVLPYQQDPGTQFALFDTKEKLASKKREIEDLYSRINSQKMEIENLNLEVNRLEKTKEDYNAQINSLRLSLDNIKPTRIVKNPTVSENPVGPRLTLNIAIAGILGLFLGVFLAFGKEWWQQSMKHRT